jgi:hypothetical protein
MQLHHIFSPKTGMAAEHYNEQSLTTVKLRVIIRGLCISYRKSDT